MLNFHNVRCLLRSSQWLSVQRNYHRLSQLCLEDCGLREAYARTKTFCQSKKLPPDVNVRGVFACNEIALQDVSVYGFDYDYTLAVYKSTLDKLLYKLSRDNLTQKFKYPKGIEEMEYKPDFVIRGLHVDIKRGLLMKLDSFLQIQLGTVYRGLTRVSDQEVMDIYRNRTIPVEFLRDHLKNGQFLTPMITQLADLFSIPQICLLSNVTEFFRSKDIDYQPEILFSDVQKAVSMSHPVMREILLKDMEEYLDPSPQLLEYIERLVSANKQLFILTNSPFKFVDRGMTLLIGPNWQKYFYFVIVNTQKSRFFADDFRPLRMYDKANDTQLWDKVTALKSGQIYYEGNIQQLQNLAGWSPGQVIYFGDHLYTGPADAMLNSGWRTGAIIKELAHEVSVMNQVDLKQKWNWLQMLTQLLEEGTSRDEPDSGKILREWAVECDTLRLEIKGAFNEQFGSVFRTSHNPSYFSRHLFRYADIYTSSLVNLLNYPVNHSFLPRRGVMPHEYTSYFS